MAADGLQPLKPLIANDPAFAEALRRTETTNQAAELIHQHGPEVTPEALCRHRSMPMCLQR